MGIEKSITPRPKLYTVDAMSFVDDSSLSVVPQAYRFGERVTRENFTNFLIGSFSRSKGSMVGLRAQFEYLRVTTGFDYDTTLNFFMGSGLDGPGGLYRLSPQERTDFVSAVQRVDTESHKQLDEGMINMSFFSNFVLPLDPEPQGQLDKHFSEERLYTQSPKEFQIYLSTYIEEQKEKQVK